jgi:proteasome accessory factor B
MARLSPTRSTSAQFSLRTRPPLHRFQQILDTLKNNSCPSRQALASDLEVTTKTIQRDIDFLRDRFRAPIEYDRDRGGYILTGPVEDLPRIELTQSELISIFVAQKALQAYRGTAFEAPLRSAFEKLTATLDGQVSVPLHQLEASLSFRQFEARPIELKVFQTVATAVQKHKLLEIEYKKLDAQKPQKRRVEPYHLACVQGQWYCIAHDLRPKALRTFHLGRIRSARLLADDFVRPKSFDIRKYLSGSLGIFAGKGNHQVVLHFDKWAAQLVREKTWHPSQKFQELTHGELELILQLNNLEEMEPWVLSWGGHVRVKGPRELKSRIRAAAEAILRLV